MKRTWAMGLAVLVAATACALPTRQPLPVSGSPALMAAGRSRLPSLLERDVTRLFNLHDADGDGFLTATEAELPAHVMPTVDTDGDGRLSPAEMLPPDMAQAYAGAMRGFVDDAFAQIDGDGDGRIVPAELAKAPILGALEQDFRWSRQVRGAGWDRATFEAQLTQTLGDQPTWRSGRTAVTSKATPVLVVQGYLEPSYYFMYGIYRHLQQEGWPVYGINLFPNVAHAEVQADKVEAKIQAILKETGASKINLVCHSFGGLISRHVIQKKGGYKYVDRYVSIATPHYGTGWCYLPGTGGACDVMRIGSPYLAELNRKTTWSPVRYSALYTKTDEITLPPKNCILPGATNYPPVPRTGHFLILWSPTTYAYVDEALK